MLQNYSEGIFIMNNNELRIMELEIRIAKLSNKPLENVNLIRKAKRQLRKLKGVD